MKKLGLLLLLVCAVAGTALAQNAGDNSTYFVTYYSNANTSGAPDATVRRTVGGTDRFMTWIVTEDWRVST